MTTDTNGTILEAIWFAADAKRAYQRIRESMSASESTPESNAAWLAMIWSAADLERLYAPDA